jgi:outer membrane protein assembly factor BamB
MGSGKAASRYNPVFVMASESLEEHLRRATRNFTTRLGEEDIFRLGLDLARELVRAHTESRHPDLEPSSVAMVEGHPRLDGGNSQGDVAEDLFSLGALLTSWACANTPEVSWRLDGPPPTAASTLLRSSTLAALATPRRVDAFPTAAAAAAALEGALSPASERDAWSLFRGDAGRSGSRSGQGAEGLIKAWEALEGAVVASPVITPVLVVVPTSDGRLLFLDRASGRKLHELRLGSIVESSPGVVEGILAVGTDDGDVIVVDLIKGEERFRQRLGQLVRSSPLALKGRLVVGLVEAGGTGALVALEPSRGKILWRKKLGAVFSSPALGGDRVLVGSDDGSLSAFELATGNLVWSHALGAKVRATPAVCGDTVVVGDFAGRLAAVGLGEGNRLWTRDVGHAMYSSPALASGLCAAGCNEGHIHGVEAATGALRFEVPTGGPVVSSPVVLRDRVVIGSTDGDLYLVDGAGTLLERTRLSPSGILSSPAVDADLLVVGSGRGVHAFHLRA